MAVSWGRGLRWLGGATLVYGVVETWRVQVREHEVAIANLPPAADGLRVLQISDLHCGLFMPPALLRRIVGLAAAQNPDMVVLTGDMVTRRDSYLPILRRYARTVTEYAAPLAEALSVLKPPHGVWAVPGNHDHWNGSFVPISDALAHAGVVPLLNSSVRLSNGLALVGLDDLRAGEPNLVTAFEGVPADEGHLILSHNPRLTNLLRGRDALVLSGHTHAGQIKIRWLFDKAPADSEQTYWQSGFYPVGRALLYVSAGTGTVGIPVRLNVPPEIVVFTLRRKDVPKVTS